MSACCSHCSHEDNHEHGHHHHEHGSGGSLGIRLVLAVVLLLVVNFMELGHGIKVCLYIAAYIVAGYEVLYQAIKGVFHGDMLNENFLMTIASAGAFALGDMNEAVSVMVFFGIGELLQEKAVQRSRQDIAKLMDIRPDSASVKRTGGVEIVAPEQVQVGELIVVKPGEKIPLDGVVQQGESLLDTVALTGESVPRIAFVGVEVYSGSVNLNGVLEIQVTKIFAESTVSKILKMVESAQNKKSQSEKFITKFAAYYTPLVVIVAGVVAVLPPALGFGDFATWLYRALTFLIVSCPCALVVSIPLSFFAGIGSAARQGILIKGANYLEALNNVDTVIFDKTGTLTKGVFEVVDIVTTPGYARNDILAWAASLEQYSLHPIAQAIMLANQHSLHTISEVCETAGKGISAVSEDGKLYVGNASFLAEIGLENLPSFEHTAVYVAVEKQFVGAILLADLPKEGAVNAMSALRECGIKHLKMFTGDNKAIAHKVATQLNIEYAAEMLPQDKVSQLEEFMQHKDGGGTTMFVGDGINDAPVITRADVGVAMGGVGSDAAIEAADVVIMNDDVSKLAVAFKVARQTRSIVSQNIVFALGIKVAVMLLAFLGMASMWSAIFADVGVAVLAVLNAVRILKV